MIDWRVWVMSQLMLNDSMVGVGVGVKSRNDVLLDIESC